MTPDSGCIHKFALMLSQVGRNKVFTRVSWVVFSRCISHTQHTHKHTNTHCHHGHLTHWQQEISDGLRIRGPKYEYLDKIHRFSAATHLWSSKSFSRRPLELNFPTCGSCRIAKSDSLSLCETLLSLASLR